MQAQSDPLSFQGEREREPGAHKHNGTRKDVIATAAFYPAPLVIMDFHAFGAALRAGLAYGAPE
jgi:hypothetical protein